MTAGSDNHSGIKTIQSYSRFARGVVWTIIALMTVLRIIMFAFPALRVWFGGINPGISRHLWTNLLFSLPVFILRIVALYQLEKLFRFYQKGQVFHSTSIRNLRRGAKLFLWSVAIELVIRLGIAVTFIKGGSSPSVIITFLQPFFGVGIALGIVGLLMLLVSRIMDEASRLSEEVKLTV